MSAADRLWNAVTHPASIGLGAVLGMLGFYKGGLIWAVLATLWANGGSLFGVGSIVVFIGEELGVPPWGIQVATVVTVVGGTIAIVKFGRRFWSGVEARTK